MQSSEWTRKSAQILEKKSLRELSQKDIDHLRLAARMGDPRACVTLAEVGEARGFLTEGEAVKLFNVGATANIPAAHFNLGSIYTSSPSTKIRKKGFQHLLVAAKHGIPEALSNLGYCLENGIGAKRDAKSAAKNYMMAFEAGMSEALSFALNVRIENASNPIAINRIRKDLEKWKRKGAAIHQGTFLRLEIKSILISREWKNLRKILSKPKSKSNGIGVELSSIATDQFAAEVM